MEFLRSLLRRRFARAQVATSRDVGCFIRSRCNYFITHADHESNGNDHSLQQYRNQRWMAVENEIAADIADQLSPM